MPKIRGAEAFHLYSSARKIWRSKNEWKHSVLELHQVLGDVRKAADLGDWGARALMAHFYREGLGVLDSNHVLDADQEKALAIVQSAAALGQPWALYDLGVAYEHGYGGLEASATIAWAYYLKAAQLGSPDAQLALADAYAQSGRLDDEESMLQCAFQHGHGLAAYQLGTQRSAVRKDYAAAARIFQVGTMFGDQDCARVLRQFFSENYGDIINDDQKPAVAAAGIKPDEERAKRYSAIAKALAINPDLRLTRLDQMLPLPPKPLPAWSGVGDAVAVESDSPPNY